MPLLADELVVVVARIVVHLALSYHNAVIIEEMVVGLARTPVRFNFSGQLAPRLPYEGTFVVQIIEADEVDLWRGHPFSNLKRERGEGI